MGTTDPIDTEKPDLKEGQILCDGCWKVAKRNEAPGWTFLKFKHLRSVDLCPNCLIGEHGIKCLHLQAQGL